MSDIAKKGNKSQWFVVNMNHTKLILWICDIYLYYTYFALKRSAQFQKYTTSSRTADGDGGSKHMGGVWFSHPFISGLVSDYNWSTDSTPSNTNFASDVQQHKS